MNSLPWWGWLAVANFAFLIFLIAVAICNAVQDERELRKEILAEHRFEQLIQAERILDWQWPDIDAEAFALYEASR